MRSCSAFSCLLFFALGAIAQPPRVLPVGELPDDRRLSELRNLNGYFPFQPVDRPGQWPDRQAEIKRRILISQGLWPMPSKTPINAVIHGRVERDDYVVDRVFFESIPGHFVTGSLYRPKDASGPLPAILSPHGHWKDGRFYQASETQLRSDLANGAERFEAAARFPIQARAVQLARMGCMVFVYDMTGNADSIQIGHRPDKWSHLDRKEDWGFFGAQAELRLQNMMGLQTWNSIRSIDFLYSLDEVDRTRIGVTGASGGGTQSMIIGAIDDRITAAMPCVMVSTSMQGGCTCENAPYLRINQGNVDIAAAIAPRPLGLTAADDWTIELETKGYPDLKKLFSDLGHADRLTAAFNVHFKHNYNHVNRAVMYDFFNRHFRLGFDGPVLERDFQPLSREEATVWSDSFYPAPSDESVGDAHEVHLLKLATEDAEQTSRELIPKNANQIQEFEHVIGGAWETILARDIDQLGEITFRSLGSTNIGELTVTRAMLEHQDESLPTLEVRLPKTEERGTVIWLSDQGKSGLFDGSNVNPVVAELATSGYTVLSADLFGQGEFTEDGNPFDRQRMWYQRGGDQGWQRFSGYTFGYNHPLMVQRTHDVLTLIRHAQNSGGSTHLVGIGKQAGAIAAAARSQAGQTVSRTFVDLDGFRFESLVDQDDPMFVPGSVKYLDVDGLLALCLPHSIDVVGRERLLVRQVAAAHDAPNALNWHADRESLLNTVRASLLR